MDPDVFTFKHDGIYLEIWSDGKIGNAEFIINCMGMPSHPHQHNPEEYQRVLQQGYVMVYPHYRGSWASSGTFSWEGCVDTVTTVMEFLRSGSASDAWGETHEWRCEDIVLLGGSFGGTTVLLAGAQTGVDTVIAVAPVVNWGEHFERTAEGKDVLRNAIDNVWSEVWRVPEDEWERLESADFNPSEYVDELADTNVLVIQGSEDEIVNPEHTKRFVQSLTGDGVHSYQVVDEGHRGSGVIGELHVWKLVKDFLRTTEEAVF